MCLSVSMFAVCFAISLSMFVSLFRVLETRAWWGDSAVNPKGYGCTSVSLNDITS